MLPQEEVKREAAATQVAECEAQAAEAALETLIAEQQENEARTVNALADKPKWDQHEQAHAADEIPPVIHEAGRAGRVCDAAS